MRGGLVVVGSASFAAADPAPAPRYPLLDVDRPQLLLAGMTRLDLGLDMRIARRLNRGIDPFSSAAWFGGWNQRIHADAPWKRALLALDPPTAKPTVWQLTDGWKRHGLLKFDERPG